MKSISDYTVNAVKTFRGHDGHGYSCNLLRNKKKVAEVVEDGWGGGLQYHWVDNGTKATVHSRTHEDKPHSFQGTAEEALFYAEVMKMPKVPASDGFPEMHTTPDIVVDDMVNELLVEKKVKADMKKTFTVKTTEGKLLSWKISPTHTIDVLKKHVIQKYPQATIINELSIAEVMKIYREEKIIA